MGRALTAPHAATTPNWRPAMSLGARLILLCTQVGSGVAWCATVAAFFAFAGLVIQQIRRSTPPPLAQTLGELALLAPLPVLALVVAAANMNAGLSVATVSYTHLTLPTSDLV